MCAINLPNVALGTVAAGIRTRALLIASPAVVVNRLINYVVSRRSVR